MNSNRTLVKESQSWTPSRKNSNTTLVKVKLKKKEIYKGF